MDSKIGSEQHGQAQMLCRRQPIHGLARGMD